MLCYARVRALILFLVASLFALFGFVLIMVWGEEASARTKAAVNCVAPVGIKPPTECQSASQTMRF